MRGNIKRTVEVKEGQNWVERASTEHPETVYRTLAEDLYRRFLIRSKNTVRVARKSHGDGTQRITVTYSNGVRAVYENIPC